MINVAMMEIEKERKKKKKKKAHVVVQEVALAECTRNGFLHLNIQYIPCGIVFTKGESMIFNWIGI